MDTRITIATLEITSRLFLICSCRRLSSRLGQTLLLPQISNPTLHQVLELIAWNPPPQYLSCAAELYKIFFLVFSVWQFPVDFDYWTDISISRLTVCCLSLFSRLNCIDCRKQKLYNRVWLEWSQCNDFTCSSNNNPKNWRFNNTHDYLCKLVLL